jgi:hypothetical protein
VAIRTRLETLEPTLPSIETRDKSRRYRYSYASTSDLRRGFKHKTSAALAFSPRLTPYMLSLWIGEFFRGSLRLRPSHFGLCPVLPKAEVSLKKISGLKLFPMKSINIAFIR